MIPIRPSPFFQEYRNVSTLTVTGNGLLLPNGKRGKPRLLVRGRRRKAVRKLLQALRVVSTQDANEETKAENEGYVPFLFCMPGTKPTQQDFNKMIGRCNDVLRATA